MQQAGQIHVYGQGRDAEDVERVERVERVENSNKGALLCPSPPYRNPMSVAAISSSHVSSVEPDALCARRREVNRPYLVDHERQLSSAQFDQIVDFMSGNDLLTDPSAEMLLVFKVVCGRWPTVEEFDRLLDAGRAGGGKKKKRLYVHVATLLPLSGEDPPVGKRSEMKNDRRISHIIGFNGSMLFDVASQSHVFLIWVMENGTMRVYTFAGDARQAKRRTLSAFRTINRLWRDYSPWPGSRSAAFSSRGLKAVPRESVKLVRDEREPYHLLTKAGLTR